MSPPVAPESPSRPGWPDLPATVRQAIEARLGAAVCREDRHSGGFSPGLASTLFLADSRSVFVKAACGAPNAETPLLHRREAVIAAALPAAAPAPRLLASLEVDGWVVVIFEAIDGRQPRLPWRPQELAAALAAVETVADLGGLLDMDLPGVLERFDGCFYGWRRLAAQPSPRIDRWSARHIERLVALEAPFGDVVAGDALVHGDARGDNVVLPRGNGPRALLVDWAWACVGVRWFDLVAMLPSVVAQGGPDPDVILSRARAARGAAPEAITVAVAGMAGFLTERSLAPAPPGLPGLRPFQRVQAAAARRWVSARTGWR